MVRDCKKIESNLQINVFYMQMFKQSFIIINFVFKTYKLKLICI